MDEKQNNNKQQIVFDPSVMRLLFLVIDIICAVLIIICVAHVARQLSMRQTGSNQGEIVIADGGEVNDGNISYDSQQEISTSGSTNSAYADYEGFEILKSNAPYALLLQSHKKLQAYADSQKFSYTKAVLEKDTFEFSGNAITYTVTLTLTDGSTTKAYARYDTGDMILEYRSEDH